MTYSLDMPFEEGPPGQTVDLSDANVSGGAVVIAGVLPVGHSTMPALVFRFATPDGRFYPPMVLVFEEDQMGKFPDLVAQAVASALRAARGSS